MTNPEPNYSTRFGGDNAPPRNAGGKPAGARNRLQGKFLNALVDDFEAHGAQAIIEMRETKPAEYIRAIASLMPKEIEISRPLDDIPDDELTAAITAVRACIAAQEVGAGVAVEAEPEQA